MSRRPLTGSDAAMVDGYTKAILTAIAVALAAIAVQQVTHRASAEADCGDRALHPCYVSITNWPR